MKTRYFLIFLMAIFVVACASKRDKAVKNIEELESVIYSDTTGSIDKSKVADLISMYINFADNYPQDEKTPVFLYSAANVSMNLMDSQKAITLFDRIMNEYPVYDKASECLFMKAFIYDNNLQDYDNARKYYEEFLEKYPDDEFADDAQASINNLGKSLEEIIQEFEQKNLAMKDSL